MIHQTREDVSQQIPEPPLGSHGVQSWSMLSQSLVQSRQIMLCLWSRRHCALLTVQQLQMTPYSDFTLANTAHRSLIPYEKSRSQTPALLRT